MELYIAVFVGFLVAILLKLNKATALPDFTWKAFFAKNWIPSVINLILGFVAIYAKEEIALIYPVTFVTAIALGAAGQFIFKGLFDAASPGVSTYLGINEDK